MVWWDPRMMLNLKFDEVCSSMWYTVMTLWGLRCFNLQRMGSCAALSWNIAAVFQPVSLLRSMIVMTSWNFQFQKKISPINAINALSSRVWRVEAAFITCMVHLGCGDWPSEPYFGVAHCRGTWDCRWRNINQDQQKSRWKNQYHVSLLYFVGGAGLMWSKVCSQVWHLLFIVFVGPVGDDVRWCCQRKGRRLRLRGSLRNCTFIFNSKFISLSFVVFHQKIAS